ncbi:ATP-binding protein [Bacillus glycinifermentans]|uniref:ATP-binding protein n=1 Tax=Bacillus glycinifermentans TaxID=1664069 RepID=UPI0008150115|nr:ATP-binding protein [Bacillus glycinifermentans]WKB76476.1 histidine kinase [Bacillus glycinifermentans]SCA87564.1 two-component sensor histidine kinase [Bacillus glycinifermentans]
MNVNYNKLSLIIILISLAFVPYIIYVNLHSSYLGMTMEFNAKNEYQVFQIEKGSLAQSLGFKNGDIIREINGKNVDKLKSNEEELEKELNDVKSLIVERDGEIGLVETGYELLSYESFFLFIIPMIFYLLSLFCVYFIIKSNKKLNAASAFILIVFLLVTSTSYSSSVGAAKGDNLSVYVTMITFQFVPVLYLHYIYQYFKEKGKVFFSNKIFLFLYPVGVLNLLVEIFSDTLEISYSSIKSFNLISFLLITTIAFSLIIYGLIKYKYSEQAYFLRILVITNFVAFIPFLIFYVIPYVFIGDYIFQAMFVVPFLLIIPFSLVYQFVATKIYDIDFLLGRFRYYGLLAILPTLISVGVITLTQEISNSFNTIKITIFIYFIMLGVFYLKEILDFHFRLKRFSEKFNYQDSIFKFTQMIRSSTSLSEVFRELANTILDVLLVSQAYVLELKNDGTVRLLSDDVNDHVWKPYEKDAVKAVTEIGKIVEVDRGFLIKIGERGGTSYVMLCLSILNTPRLTRDEISWLETLAFYTSVSLENVLKIGELMEHLENVKKEGPNPAWLNKLMFAIEEKQRSDLARDLHDSVLQDMISLKHQSEMFLADFEKDKVCTAEIEQRLVNMNEQMSNVIQMTRETCQELRPQLLYDLGLVKALSKLAAQHQESSSIRIRLNTERFSKVLDLDTQLNLYRIVQELLSNAVKHSKAHEVLVMLVCIKEKVVLHYEDDGIGFDQDKLYQNSSSMGLSGIRERVRALNGKLDIKTAEGKGFKVIIEMEL